MCMTTCLSPVTVCELVFAILEKGRKTEMRFRTWVKGDINLLKQSSPKAERIHKVKLTCN